MNDTRLVVAVGINVLLALAQIAIGVISGSLSLIADALHNLSDAASLGIALFARRIGRKLPDEFKTFDYKRAEVIAALINLTTLVIIGFLPHLPSDMALCRTGRNRRLDSCDHSWNCTLCGWGHGHSDLRHVKA